MSEIPENISTEPFFVPKLKTVNSGVDFLNLGQVNFELMAECMPGTNNVTYYVRPYSLICWIYWTYREQLRKKGEENASLEDQHLFREKVESLHLWGHKLNKLRGTPGLGSKIPKPKGERQAFGSRTGIGLPLIRAFRPGFSTACHSVLLPGWASFAPSNPGSMQSQT